MIRNDYILRVDREWRAWQAEHERMTTARESAYRIIREKIISLDLKPGEPLRDKDLAEELDMGRTPVREALVMLTDSSLVLFKPQSGTFVAPIDVERMKLEQFSRFAIEKEVVTRACGKIPQNLAEDYHLNMEAYRQLEMLGVDNAAKYMLGVDNAFHSIAFEAVGMKQNFFHMIRTLQHMERMRLLSIMCMDQELLVDEHGEIAKAMIEGDLVGAQYWLQTHLSRYKENLQNVKNRYPEYFELG